MEMQYEPRVKKEESQGTYQTEAGSKTQEDSETDESVLEIVTKTFKPDYEW